MAPASRVLYLGTKGKRSSDSWAMCQVWMPSNPTNIAIQVQDPGSVPKRFLRTPKEVLNDP